jgi:hypothetical protein
VDADNVGLGWDVLAGRTEPGKRVALVSQECYFETPNIAEYLAAKGHQVEIFHMWSHIGSEIDRYSLGTIMKRLEDAEVIIHHGLRLSAVDDEKLTFISSYSGKENSVTGFDSIVLVYGSVPDSSLYDELKADGSVVDLFVAGSAWSPRRLAEATSHGARIALTI